MDVGWPKPHTFDVELGIIHGVMERERRNDTCHSLACTDHWWWDPPISASWTFEICVCHDNFGSISNWQSAMQPLTMHSLIFCMVTIATDQMAGADRMG